MGRRSAAASIRSAMPGGVSLIREFYGTAPDLFAWREPPYEYEHEKMPIDIMAGSSALRGQVEAQASLAEIEATWVAGENEFREQRQPHLLYR